MSDPPNFDPAKERKNERKHCLDFGLAKTVFDGPYVEGLDTRFDYGEERRVATGPVAALSDRLCVVVYTWRAGERRIISFRKAND